MRACMHMLAFVFVSVWVGVCVCACMYMGGVCGCSPFHPQEGAQPSVHLIPPYDGGRDHRLWFTV